MIIGALKEEVSSCSISWPQEHIGDTQSWKLCLDLWVVVPNQSLISDESSMKNFSLWIFLFLCEYQVLL